MTLVPLGDGPGDAWTIRADDGRRFAVFAVDGGHRVTDLLCPHNRGPLVQGTVRPPSPADDRPCGPVLTCPWHWYRFDLDSGRCLTQPAFPLAVYPVVERDGMRYADVGEKPEPRSMSQLLRAHARGEDR